MTRPTNAELDLLQILWTRGASSVSDLLEVLHGDQPTRYTTVLKTLQNMYDKGLVTREKDGRRHLYSAKKPKEKTQGELLVGLIHQAFSGSRAALVSRALEDGPVSADEISELRDLLDSLEKTS